MQFKLKIISLCAAFMMFFLMSCDKECVIPPTETAFTLQRTSENTQPMTATATDRENASISSINSFSVDVVRGNPRRGCRPNFGFCTMAPTNRSGVLLTFKSGKLSLIYDKNAMDRATFITHFSSGRFLMEEAFEVPPAILAQLGISTYLIQAGSYAIQESATTLTVNF